MNKQITIYDLLPFLKPGCVVMNSTGTVDWFECVPIHLDNFPSEGFWFGCGQQIRLSDAFNIEPWIEDWKHSLIEVKSDIK